MAGQANDNAVRLTPLNYPCGLEPIHHRHIDVQENHGRKVREGQAAAGLYRGPSIDRIRFEDLAALVEQDYPMNRRKTVRRIAEYQKRLEPYFRRSRVSAMTTERVNAYIIKRQDQGAANGTINREIGLLKRMFRTWISTDTATRRPDSLYSLAQRAQYRGWLL